MRLFRIESERTQYIEPPIVVYVVAPTIDQALRACPGFYGGANAAKIEELFRDVIIVE